MDVVQFINHLEFEDDFILYNYINSIGFIDLEPLVTNRLLLLVEPP